MDRTQDTAGHRARLRERFIREGKSFPDPDLLELILTYAIPRLDVAPHTERLLQRFGSLAGVLSAPYTELLEVPGIGEATAILLTAIGMAHNRATTACPAPPAAPLSSPDPEATHQPMLFEPEEEKQDGVEEPKEVEIADRMGVFANDEATNALVFIPRAIQFPDIEAFRAYLRERLPYNSVSTRMRRANYIVERFFPDGRLDGPLAYFAAHCTSEADLKPVLFYHTLKAEPLAARIAEDLIWPALPSGRVERETVREFILRYLPDLSASSQTKVLQTIFRTYDVLGIGAADGKCLRFQSHAGTLEGFLYVLTAEHPQPTICAFETLEAGPLRRWLLWDRDWMERQLYNLQDLGILSKVSQIDAVRQFTLSCDQMTALRRYFENPGRRTVALRDGPALNGGEGNT